MEQQWERGAAMAVTSKPRILIVDDVASNIKTAIAVLGQEYQLFVSTSGEEALRIARSMPLDLVLLDITMPGMDGYEVCRRLKADPVTQDLIIVFLSARDEIMDEVKGFMLGGSEFLLKPIEPVLFKVRVLEHLRRAITIRMLRDRIQHLVTHGTKLVRSAMNGDVRSLDHLLDMFGQQEICDSQCVRQTTGECHGSCCMQSPIRVQLPGDNVPDDAR
jgi:putative two-component system response regulator